MQSMWTDWKHCRICCNKRENRMRILFAGSKKQQIAGIVYDLGRMGHEIAVYPKPLELVYGIEKEEKALGEFLKNSRVDLAISTIFSVVMAEQTHKLGIKYVVYGMDSPMYATYLPVTPHYDNCYLFYFDYREYQMVRKMGYTNAYYLSLAGDIKSAEDLVITDEEIEKYRCNISFVGSLYSENIYDEHIDKIPEDIQQTLSEMMEQSAFIWDGRDRIGELLTPELTRTIKCVCPEIYNRQYEMPDEYYLKTYFLERKMTHIERTCLMQLLAEQYDIHLYTWENQRVPNGIRRFPAMHSQEEALKVFYSSKININITLRSIESGIPARVFDIMSVGGFLISNYQEEIPELFEVDKEIVTFKTPEELFDKIDYYLAHDEERVRIGINGYRKVKQCYTYEHQLNKILSVL